MGLIEKIFGGESGADKFADQRLESLMKDKDIRHYFFNDDGTPRTGRDIDLLKKGLHDKIRDSYNTKAKPYFEERGWVSKYVSPVLRGIGAVGDAIGTYLFWMYGGSGFETKFVSMGIKSLADIIDGYHYLKHNHKGYDIGAIAKIAGETVVERAAAIWPFGVGEAADLLRGRKKFDAKVVGKTVEYAKTEFIKAFGDYVPMPEVPVEEPVLVPLAEFNNPLYTKAKKKAA